MANGLVKWWRARFLAGYRPFSGNDFPFFLLRTHSAGMIIGVVVVVVERGA